MDNNRNRINQEISDEEEIIQNDPPPPPPPPSEATSSYRQPILINPPYPWSTNLRAKVHSLNYLLSNQILTISGDVECRFCRTQYQIHYDLLPKFIEIVNILRANCNIFHERSVPTFWRNPNLPNCQVCGRLGTAKPVIPVNESDYDAINWLFLLLGQMLGCLTLNHLRYFCDNTPNPRTGSKNRLLSLTYLTLCKQLLPS